jgi:hypothetical protein
MGPMPSSGLYGSLVIGQLLPMEIYMASKKSGNSWYQTNHFPLQPRIKGWLAAKPQRMLEKDVNNPRRKKYRK